MTILNNILLGVLVGYYLAFARVDSIWWPYIGSPVGNLKSKVSATSRSNAAAFYRSMNESPYNMDYFLLVTFILVVLSFVGGIVQHPAKRLQCIFSLILTIAAGVVEYFYARSIVTSILSKSSGKLIENLFNLGFYHAIVFGSLVVTCFLQISTESLDEGEEDDDEEEKPKKSKKKKVE